MALPGAPDGVAGECPTRSRVFGGLARGRHSVVGDTTSSRGRRHRGARHGIARHRERVAGLDEPGIDDNANPTLTGHTRGAEERFDG